VLIDGKFIINLIPVL